MTIRFKTLALAMVSVALVASLAACSEKGTEAPSTDVNVTTPAPEEGAGDAAAPEGGEAPAEAPAEDAGAGEAE